MGMWLPLDLCALVVARHASVHDPINGADEESMGILLVPKTFGCACTAVEAVE